MENFAKYKFFTQESALSDIQMANSNGIFTQSLLIDILFIIFVVLTIAYLIWMRKLKK